MGFTKKPLLIVAGYVISYATAAAESLCPAGPFETDVRKIATAIAAEQPKPDVRDAVSPASGTPENEQLTDGAIWTAAGGLGGHSAVSLLYDAKRYVVVNVVENWPLRDVSDFSLKPARPEPVKPIPNQVIRHVGEVTYTTTTARPTPEQAREFACLANRLLAPPLEEKPSTSSVPPSNPQTPPEVTVTGRRICSPGEFTDAHVEGFQLLSSKLGPGPALTDSSGIPCATRRELQNHMEEVAYDPINEVIERGKGTWQSPHVHSVAVDAADNLYLLIDPGTNRPRTIDVRKITPSGDVTRLSANTAERFYAGAFTVDGQGHARVPIDERTGTVIYDVAPGGDPDSVERIRRLSSSDRAGNYVRIESIAADSNNNLYAMSGFEILKITPAGAVTPLVNSNIRQHPMTSWYTEQPTYIAVSPDGTIFVSESTYNIIVKVTPDGAVTILAGTPNEMGTIDGPGKKALFSLPKGLVLDREGTLYVADSGNQTIRRITPDGRVSTLAGRHGKRGSVDGQGRSARFDSPASIAIDSTGTLYVTNGTDNRIRKVSAAGVVGTLNAQRFIDAQ
jgi:sugar lactone lactonase YvrE